MSYYLKSIVNAFTPDARQCLDTAVSQAVSRTHHEVCIEHLLLAVVTTHQSLVEQLCIHAGLRGDVLLDALKSALDRHRAGNTQAPVLSESLVEHLEKSWLHASVRWQQTSLPAPAFIACLLQALHGKATGIAQGVTEALKCDADFADSLLAGCCTVPARQDRAGVSTGHDGAALKKYTHNLTEQARLGRLDPAFGREDEIRQMIDVLLRRRQNNPVLTGEPGVGKTALVEGLAQRIADGTVPKRLQEMAVLTLDLSLLQAGASVKGEFEQRLQSVLNDVKSYGVPVILFIDEAHMLVGAGGQAGQNDAANLLKPALARGEIRMIGATTWAEYKKYFEKDAALARRFQMIKVAEPDTEAAIAMLRSVAPAISAHHGVQITDGAIVSAVELSRRYISERQLPDKSITLLDTACSRVALSRCHQPREIEDLNALLRNIATERRSIAEDLDSAERLQWLEQREADIRLNLDTLTPEWDAQRALVSRITECQDSPVEKAALQAQLHDMHQHHALVFDRVDPASVADVISRWTGIPIKQVTGGEEDRLATLMTQLEQRVVGQTEALKSIVQHIRISRAGLSDPQKPTGVFMLAGPSGTGKTETALALAERLFGGSKSLISINMSEYQEAHSVAGLKGSPPGYVGYGQGGVLTEAVRRQPYSVILLDEVEKAHPDVMELFYQVFDKGMLEDSEGLKVDFRNTLILLTSNLGSERLMAAADDDIATLTGLIRPELERVFRPALMGRLTLLPYLPLNGKAIKQIIRLKIGKVCERFVMGDARQRSLTWSTGVVDYVAGRCNIAQSGARDIDAVLGRELLPLLTDYVLGTDSNTVLHLRIRVSGKCLTLIASA